MAIFKEPWYADLVNYPLSGHSKTSVISLPKYGTSSRKSCIFLSIIPTRLFDDAYQRKNRGVWLAFAMNLHVADILVLAKPQRKFYKVDFTGPLYSKTDSIFVSYVRIVKRLGRFQETRHDAPEPDSQS